MSYYNSPPRDLGRDGFMAVFTWFGRREVEGKDSCNSIVNIC